MESSNQDEASTQASGPFGGFKFPWQQNGEPAALSNMAATAPRSAIHIAAGISTWTLALACKERDWLHQHTDSLQAPLYSQTEQHKQRKSLSKQVVPSLRMSSRHVSGSASGAPGSHPFCNYAVIIAESTYPY